MKAKEKLMQYGLPALTDNELLEVLKYKKPIEEYYQSPEFKAAKELVRRYEKPENIVITSSKKAAEILSFLEHENEEYFWAIYLNKRNSVIKYEFISKGSATQTVVDTQKIYRRALELKSQAIIIAHNHPSGNVNPSQADINITKEIKAGAALLQIQLLDHTIIANGKYFSFADEGIL
jgi:DNA repair protein RadC